MIEHESAILISAQDHTLSSKIVEQWFPNFVAHWSLLLEGTF